MSNIATGIIYIFTLKISMTFKNQYTIAIQKSNVIFFSPFMYILVLVTIKFKQLFFIDNCNLKNSY